MQWYWVYIVVVDAGALGFLVHDGSRGLGMRWSDVIHSIAHTVHY
jgi:hypothetical protein